MWRVQALLDNPAPAAPTYAANDPVNHIDPTGESCWFASVRLSLLRGGKIRATVKGNSKDDGLGKPCSGKEIHIRFREDQKQLADSIPYSEDVNFRESSAKTITKRYTFPSDEKANCKTKSSDTGKYYIQTRLSWPDGFGAYPMPWGVPGVPKPPFDYAESKRVKPKMPNCKE